MDPCILASAWPPRICKLTEACQRLLRLKAQPAAMAPFVGGAALPQDLESVAEAFVGLQQARHDADYDLAKRFTRTEAQALVDLAGAAVEALGRVSGDPHCAMLLVAFLDRHDLLHDDGERDILGADALPRAVAEGARRPERRPAAIDGLQHVRITAHVEVGFLLARDRHPRQILRRGRRAHGDGWVIRTQVVIFPADQRGDVIRYRALRKEGLDLLRSGIERGGVVCLCLGSGGEDRLSELVLVYEAAIGVGGEVKAGGRGQARRRQARQRRALAAHAFQRGGGAVEREDQWLIGGRS